MNPLNKLVVAVAFALPLVASAQTTPSPDIKPADQPRTQLEKDQTTKNGQATKYGAPGTDTGGAMSKDHSAKKKRMKADRTSTENTTLPGDLSTYPGPSREPSSTK